MSADIVFLIFLYQRWIYKVDPTRVNEFGTSGESDSPPLDDNDQSPEAICKDEPAEPPKSDIEKKDD